MTSSPFKFLDSYSLADHGTFFGRDRESGELFRQCFTGPILVVYGGSGTGKTSLVQCGLASRFLESDWLPILVRRSGDMLTSLLEAVEANTLTASTSTGLNERVANLYLDHFKPIYFIFDQFEELFIFGKQQESETFFAAIHNVLEAQRSAHAIFIVREEYLAELTRYEHLVPGLIENRYRVERMARSHAVEVVEKLCAANGIQCSAGFSSAMVDRLNPEGHGVELSYLQVYLDRCWRSRQNDEPFSIALLERIGYVDDLLGAFLDEQVADTPEPERAEALLKTFVSDQGTKRQLTTDEAHEWVNAIGTAMEPAEVDRLLQVFVTKRLLKERDERGRYELLHDALARQIFQRITRAEQELIEVRQFVQQAYGQYEKRGAKLTANDLTYLRPYRGQLHLKGEVKGFVEGAFGEEERRVRRKKRVIGIGLGLLFLIGLAGGLFVGDLQKRLDVERNQNMSSQLAEYAMAYADKDPQRAYLAAERAYELDPSLAASRAILRTYNSLYPIISNYAGTIARVADDKHSFIIIDPEKGFAVYDLNGRELFSRPLTAHQPGGIRYVAGDHVLCVDSAVSIYDLSGRVIFGCDTADWIGYSSEGQFVGVTKDTLLIEKSGSFRKLGWRTSTVYSPRGFSHSGTTAVGFLDSSTIYMFDTDSLRILRIRGAIEIEHVVALPDGFSMLRGKYAGVVSGTFCIDTGLGIYAFKRGPKSWEALNMDYGPMSWTHFYSDAVLINVNGPGKDLPHVLIYAAASDFKHPKKISGWLIAHFPSSGMTLTTPSEDKREPTRLFHTDGKVVLEIDGTPAAFDDQGFITISDTTVSTDLVSVWSQTGKRELKLITKKVLAKFNPPEHAIWLDRSGDSTIVHYLSEDKINGEPTQILRSVEHGQVQSYIPLGDVDFNHRNMAFAFGEDRLLVNKGAQGHSLVDRRWKNVTVPMLTGDHREFIFRDAILPSGFAQWNASRVNSERSKGDSTTAYSSWAYSMWRPQGFHRDSIIHDGSRMRDRSIFMGENDEFSPKGDYFKLVHIPNYWKDYSASEVSVWDVRSGELLNGRTLIGAEDILWNEYETSSFTIIRSDSILLVSSDFARSFTSVPRDSSRVASLKNEPIHVFWNKESCLVRVIHPKKRVTSALVLDRTKIDPRFDLDMPTWPNSTRISAQSDSVVYFILNYWSGGGVLQRFVNGVPAGTIDTPGSSTIVYRDGEPRICSRKITIKDGDFGIQQDPGGEVTYYALDVSETGMTMNEIPMSEAEAPEMMFNIVDDRIRIWDQDLLQLDARPFDIPGTGKAFTSHRLLDRFELFPMDPKEAIRMVREEKVYGEFWKNINIDPLVKKIAQ
ncbi:MAG TPA: ATP-binding protein [Flavobacteriales bacterium]|nr:ATP-binding protein [Flavobacteriales bacterium]